MVTKLAKSLRQDIRSKAERLMERAQLLTLIDPDFQKELKALGLIKAFEQTLGPIDQVESAQARKALASKREPRQRAPLKYWRRQMKHDFITLMEEVQLLRQLDPSGFEPEVKRLGLTVALDKLK